MGAVTGPGQTSSGCTQGLLMIVFIFSFLQYCVWTDGLNALLGKDMLSDLTRNDLDTLLSMEIKLRLLDLENIQIPDAPPPIPKEPSNYDFVYDCNWGCHWNWLRNWKYYNWRDIENKKRRVWGKTKKPTCAPWILALGRGVETLAFLPAPCIPSVPIPIFPIAHPNPHCFN